MQQLFLFRASLRDDLPVSALRGLLVPVDESARIGAAHKLLWAMFGDRSDRTRDFLWREAAPGKYFVLSQRSPEDVHGLFAIDPPKPFEPRLAIGDKLQFALRANATVARPTAKGGRGKPHDVVMDALYSTPSGSRAAVRQRVVEAAGLAWLARQGERHGFQLCAASELGTDGAQGSEGRASARVLGYRTLRIEHRGPRAQLGVLDFEGTLEVSDPAAFLEAIGNGFGRAKAFGCGLMLIRRARMAVGG